jgi:hypothetical protein
MQVFRDDVEVFVHEPFIEFVEEFELGGFGHLGEAAEGGPL